MNTGKLIPMWYRAVARLLRRETSLPAFVEKFSSPEPPFPAHINEENAKHLREHVLQEAGLQPQWLQEAG